MKEVLNVPFQDFRETVHYKHRALLQPSFVNQTDTVKIQTLLREYGVTHVGYTFPTVHVASGQMLQIERSSDLVVAFNVKPKNNQSYIRIRLHSQTQDLLLDEVFKGEKKFSFLINGNICLFDDCKCGDQNVTGIPVSSMDEESLLMNVSDDAEITFDIVYLSETLRNQLKTKPGKMLLGNKFMLFNGGHVCYPNM